MPRHNPRRFLDVAVRAARRAGALLTHHLGRPLTIETKRSAIDLVTVVDRHSERILHEAIRRHFPDHGFHGEERLRTNPNSPYQWLVDPLDGTTNFVHGVPTFAISIGLLCDDELLVGVIYDPTRSEMFTAIKETGAWLNGKRIRVSRTRHIADSLLGTGFPPTFRDNPHRYLAWFEAFQSRCHAVRRIGSTALSLAYVACGRQDGLYEEQLWPWDIAAGILLVEEAGGRVTDFHGRPIRRLEDGRIVASNGSLHNEMLALLTNPPRRGSRQRDRLPRATR